MPNRPRRWRISIRWSLFINLLLLVVLISGSLLAYSLAGARRAVRRFSVSIIEEAAAKAQDRLGRFFAPVTTSIGIVRDFGEIGTFSPSDPRRAGEILIPVLAAIPQMSAANTGDQRGDALLVVKRKTEWLSISKRGKGQQADWAQVDERGAVLKSWRQELDFDPRSRPWYKLVDAGASESTIYWTAPYGFVPTGDPGITAAVRVVGPKEPYILAFDVLLEDLSDFAQSIEVSPKGKTFVLTEDLRLLAPPAGMGTDARGLLLSPAAESGIPLVAESVQLWREQPGLEPFQFTQDGATWWCGFRPYALSEGQRFWIGVLVPEEDVLGETRRERVALLYLTVGALLVAVLMALVLSRSYSAPLGRLVEHSTRLQRLETSQEVRVPSRLNEVRQLADAQENMRRALDSFARYVPIEVVRELLDRGEAATIGARSAEVTVLFTDIVGFTAISESMSAADLTQHMSSYFDEVLAVLQSHGATVDKFIGDAVMAFWGAPHALDNHSRPAVEAVLEIRQRLGKANQAWMAQGLPALQTRFGLASGTVAVGNIGAHHRLSYTVLGDPVNLAHRLEALNPKFGSWVLADERVRSAAGDDFAWRDVDPVEIKGKAGLTRIFELLGRK